MIVVCLINQTVGKKKNTHIVSRPSSSEINPATRSTDYILMLFIDILKMYKFDWQLFGLRSRPFICIHIRQKKKNIRISMAMVYISISTTSIYNIMLSVNRPTLSRDAKSAIQLHQSHVSCQTASSCFADLARIYLGHRTR